MEDFKIKTFIFDTKEEWLEFKKGKLGASTSGTICGYNDYTSPLEQWERFTGRVPPITSTVIMRAGAAFEGGIMELFEDDNEVEFLRDRSKILLYQSVDYPFLISTPDDEAIYLGELHNVEIKYTAAFWEIEEIPSMYKAQVQKQMHLSGIEKTLFIWFHAFKRDYRFVVIDYDKDFAESIIQTEIQFYDLIVNDIPPPPISYIDYARQKSNSKTIQATEEILPYLLEIYSKNEEAKGIKNKQTWLKTKIAAFMENNETVKYGDDILVTFKPQKNGVRKMLPNYRNIENLQI